MGNNVKSIEKQFEAIGARLVNWHAVYPNAEARSANVSFYD